MSDYENRDKAAHEGCAPLTCSASSVEYALPIEAGHYWWREHERKQWRVLRVCKLEGSRPQLIATATDGAWLLGDSATASLEWWEVSPHPFGQWVEIPLPNVNEHAPPLAKASIVTGIGVHDTCDVADRTASGGCCVSSCCAIAIHASDSVTQWRLLT